MAFGAILGQSFETSPVLDNYFTKDETLTSSTAALFGLGADSVPDDVLAYLGKYTPKIATGSYVGTGKYGSSNPNSLTFEFAPKLLFITQQQGEGDFWGIDSIDGNPMDCTVLTTSYVSGLGFATTTESDHFSGYAKKSEDGRTITWYHRDNVSSQLNSAGYTYYYFAIS